MQSLACRCLPGLLIWGYNIFDGQANIAGFADRKTAYRSSTAQLLVNTG